MTIGENAWQRPRIGQLVRRIGSGLALATLACARDEGSGALQRRDSAGVEIVDSRVARWSAADRWTIDDRPAVTIGGEGGHTEYQFSLVRGTLRLPNGQILVSDDRAGRLWFFDATGALVKSTGGSGRGPGEFGYSVLRIWRAPSGELLVTDAGNNRTNVFDENGTFVRSIQLAPSPDVPQVNPIDVFAGGNLLAAGVVGGPTSAPAAPAWTVTREHLYFRYSIDGELLGRILSLPGRPQHFYSFAGTVGATAVPLTADHLVAVQGDTVLVYRGPREEVELWTQDGRLRRIIRWEGAPDRRVADVWDRYTAAALEAEGVTPFGRQAYAHFFSLSLPLPELVPSTERLIVDAEENLWALRYRLPWESDLQWDIVSGDGDWLGTVTSPPDLTVHQIGRDFVLGVHRDSLGVERVRLHALERREARDRRD